MAETEVVGGFTETNLIAQHFAERAETTSHLQIATIQVELTTSPDLLEQFLYSTGHLLIHDPVPPPVRQLRLIRRGELLSGLPAFGERRVGFADGMNYEVLAELDAIGFKDDFDRHLLVLGDGVPRLDRPEVMRVIVDWLLSDQELFALHGATISWGGRTALVSNRGGSGKSTTTAVAVAAGASTCGDDFLLADEGFRVYSISRTFKLAHSSPARQMFAALRQGVAPPPEYQDESNEKALLLLDELGGGRVLKSTKPDILLIPFVSDGWKVGSISELDVLQAVAPNSIAMNRNRSSALHYLKRLISTLPAYRLDVGPDLAAGMKFLQAELD